MFNIGEKARIDTYNKEHEIFVRIIGRKIVNGEVAYIVKFRNGEKGTFLKTELLKIQ